MKYMIVFGLLLAVAMSACRTKDKDTPGKGGSSYVKIYPAHHTRTRPLVGMVVYVKYGTMDAPSNGSYDDSMLCINNDTVVSCTFTGLRNGYYYFFGKGYDTSVRQPVKGGAPCSIEHQGGGQEISLSVSED